MNVLWVKDGKIGHEKQVKVLLDELSKTLMINVTERNVKGLYPIYTYLSDIKENFYDLIIGAGHKVYAQLIDVKKYQNKKCKNIAILTPSFNKSKFDIICAPFHDKNSLKNQNNVIFYEGSLAKVSNKVPDENIGLIALGGRNKHYKFDENELIKQIEYIYSLYPNKKWFIFFSRRTTTKMINKLAIFDKYSNITISNNNIDELYVKASIKFITQDSVNMVYESLSTKGSTYLFNMKYFKKNKIVNQINNLINDKKVGYIKYEKMADGLNKIILEEQNIYNDVFAEVEKLSYQLEKLI